MTISGGLPLHPLLVHAIVVLMPLTAIAAILHSLWPVAARRLGVVTPLAALGVLVLVPITQQAGEDLERQLGVDVHVHQQRAEALLPWSIALFVISLALWLWHGPVLASRREQVGSGAALAIRVALIVAALVIGVGTVIAVVLAGDSGARAVWSGVGS